MFNSVRPFKPIARFSANFRRPFNRPCRTGLWRLAVGNSLSSRQFDRKSDFPSDTVHLATDRSTNARARYRRICRVRRDVRVQSPRRTQVIFFSFFLPRGARYNRRFYDVARLVNICETAYAVGQGDSNAAWVGGRRRRGGGWRKKLRKTVKFMHLDWRVVVRFT